MYCEPAPCHRPLPSHTHKKSCRRGEQRPVAVAEAFARLARQLLHRFGKRDGVVNVVTQPGAQGDVPALPEPRGGAREERLAEILGQTYVEDAAHAEGYVHGAGEVAVQLQGIEHRRHGNHRTVVGGVVGEHRLHEGIQAVGDDHLLRQAPQHPQAARVQVRPRHRLAGHKGVSRLAVTANGPLHNLREVAEEQRHTAQIAIGGHRAAEHIDQVGAGHQGVERDADRGGPDGQLQIQRDAHRRASAVDDGAEEGQVFESGQKPEVHNEARRQHELHLPGVAGADLALAGLDGFHSSIALADERAQPQAGEVDGQRGHPQRQDKRARQPEEERVAGNKQHHPAGTARGNSVQHYDGGKKRRQKYEGEI